MHMAGAAARGAAWGLVVAYAWVHRMTILMFFVGAAIASLLVGWYWNNDANEEQMRNAIDPAYGMRPSSGFEMSGPDMLAGVIITNNSRYDMTNIQMKCGEFLSNPTSQVAESSSETSAHFTFEDVGTSRPTEQCEIVYDPVDRSKLSEDSNKINSAGSF